MNSQWRSAKGVILHQNRGCKRDRHIPLEHTSRTHPIVWNASTPSSTLSLAPHFLFLRVGSIEGATAGSDVTLRLPQWITAGKRDGGRHHGQEGRWALSTRECLRVTYWRSLGDVIQGEDVWWRRRRTHYSFRRGRELILPTYVRVCVWGWPTDETLAIWYKERVSDEGEGGHITA